MKVEAYKRSPGGGYHWRIRDADGRVVEESAGAFYDDRGDAAEQAICAASKVYARSGVTLTQL